VSSIDKALKAQEKLASSLSAAFSFATSSDNPVAHITVAKDIGSNGDYYISVGLKRSTTKEEEIFMPSKVDDVIVDYEVTGNFKPSPWIQ
jgi:hypothetical protein